MKWTGTLQPNEFWGKLSPRAGPGERLAPAEWHPVQHHSLDVAACLHALLDVEGIRRSLEALAGQPLAPPLRDRLVWLAGVHDLGKYNHGFQGKAWGSGGAGHVDEAWLLVTHCGAEGQRARGALGLDRLAAWGDAARPLLWASVSHHGTPAQTGAPGWAHLWEARPNRDPFVGLAALRAAVDAVAPAAFEGARELPDAPAFVHACAGLFTLADWIGSDVAHFPYSISTDAPRWLVAAARQRLVTIGIDARRVRAARTGWTPTVDALVSADAPRRPRPAQEVIGGARFSGTGGSLAILEAETGSGKTEAAFVHFFHLFQSGAVDGMFFALPTRTSAVQIHRRIAALARRHLGEAVEVVRAVPGYVAEGDQAPLSDTAALWPANRESWAAEQPKRFLAGTVVVGTIDQALLGCVQLRHAHLRGSLLLRHLLVVDEVHASDPYMRVLLRELLDRQALVGGHTLLLSATLALDTRDTFIQTLSKKGPRLGERCSYPALTLVTTATVEHRPVTGAEPREVRMEVAPVAGRFDAIAARAVAAARGGARVLVVRNTVGDALATQREVEKEATRVGGEEVLFRVAGHATPHHSRYAAEDRRCLDKALEERFGAPGGFVVVATQTVEQSLDIDADLLLTDLCPVDVLLQRVGRLHRHRDRDADRPAGFTSAVCGVLVPEERDLRKRMNIDEEGSTHGLGSVYADVVALEGTWRLLEQRQQWVIPRDNRMLVEAALSNAARDTIAAEDAGWEKKRQAVWGKEITERGLARDVRLSWSREYGEFPSRDAGEKISARLGANDLRIALPPGTPGAFVAEVRSIVVPDRYLRAVDDRETFEVEPREGGFRLRWAGVTLEYGRWGLHQA